MTTSQAGSPMPEVPKSITAASRPSLTRRFPAATSPWNHTGVPCQVALEAPMACGFGACYGCAVELDGRLQRLCIEGPVVAAERT